jgi:hypothetical protein
MANGLNKVVLERKLKKQNKQSDIDVPLMQIRQSLDLWA